jgi:hypothetical protein
VHRVVKCRVAPRRAGIGIGIARKIDHIAFVFIKKKQTAVYLRMRHFINV